MKLLGIELNEKEFDFLMCEQSKGKQLKVIDGKVIAVNPVISEEEIRLNRINELKHLLKESDYQAIKFAEGKLSSEQYKPVELQREAWRAEINLLQEVKGE